MFSELEQNKHQNGTKRLYKIWINSVDLSYCTYKKIEHFQKQYSTCSANCKDYNCLLYNCCKTSLIIHKQNTKGITTVAVFLYVIQQHVHFKMAYKTYILKFFS